jgi:hypothetical protein
MVPQCKSSEVVVMKKDNRGCNYPSCEAKLCPVSEPPQCPGGTVVELTDNSGCKIYSCQNKRTCPVSNIPSCKTNELVEVTHDSNGCEVASCKKKTCPIQIKAPTCPSNYELISSVGPDACTVYSCQPHQCPVSQITSCQINETLSLGQDKYGCVTSRCVHKICPVVDPAPCDGGDLIQVTGADGCKSYRCERHICPQSTQQICDGNQVLSTTTDNYGCKIPVCVPRVCPVSDPAPCPNGVLEAKKDTYGCTVWSCTPKPNVCPQYQIPVCRGEISYVTDAAGCEKPVCLTNPNPSCPIYATPNCGGRNLLKVYTDMMNCPIAACQ